MVAFYFKGNGLDYAYPVTSKKDRKIRDFERPRCVKCKIFNQEPDSDLCELCLKLFLEDC
jgi:hypothetical protein